jgi:hypothetical protein
VLNEPYELHVRPSVAVTASTAAWLVTVSIAAVLQLRPVGAHAVSQLVPVLSARTQPPSASGRRRQARAALSQARGRRITTVLLSAPLNTFVVKVMLSAPLNTFVVKVMLSAPLNKFVVKMMLSAPLKHFCSKSQSS